MPSHAASSRIEGAYYILSTPFTSDRQIDIVSLRRLTAAIVEMGVSGITVLGVAGEAHKLSAVERSHVVDVVMQVVAGRLPVVVGTSADGTDNAVALSREAESAGASAVMVAPPTFLGAGVALTGHYQAIAAAVSIPLVLQDYPPINGVVLSPQQLGDLVAAVPAITCVKLEGTPTPLRIHDLLASMRGNASVVGGLGGMYLLDELRRGSSGTMTGFAYPEPLIEICRAWASGDRDTAARIYCDWLPLLVLEGQPGVSLGIRKELLRRRGLIDSGHVRGPGGELAAALQSDITETLGLIPAIVELTTAGFVGALPPE